ncbi:MAG: DUF2723 domain-containing protein [Rikenellaceae bacterium]
MKSFKFWNRVLGWGVFAIAAIVYLLTMEPSSSLWDCGEFIATSYKLEVGHPPGAPLFMILARIATIFAPSTYYVPHMVNAMNCFASAFTILFLFWTITHLARRMFTHEGDELTETNGWATLAAGIIGALSYTFTDTFWYSAVEGEVYALSSMFTALVVWLMLKWDEEADEPHSLRWIILIAYLMGLSIGVHILNLLTIPALVFIYYFRRCSKVTLKGIVLSTLVSGAILIFVNGFVLSQSIYMGAMVDTFFVNSLGLPVNSGMVVFSLALIGALGYASYYTHQRRMVLMNVIALSLTMLFIGYSSYASVTIRAVTNPPMNSNHPANPHALLSLLSRDQYGSRPLIYGASYAAPVEDYTKKSFYYLSEEGRYEKGEILSGYTYPSEFMKLFPRMWDSRRGESGYKPWAAYRTKVAPLRDAEGNIERDENGRVAMAEQLEYGEQVYYNGESYTEPTFGENANFFLNYQLGYMFWRYFLWNFVGRQSDVQASKVTIADGNWLSGVKFIDEAYLGPQDNLPREMAENRGRNRYYFLPFLLGLLGLLWQLNVDQKRFSIVMWLFVMMGIALVVYFNTSPSEPRERDYVFAGAFYAYSIWIGFGVLALRELIEVLSKRSSRKTVIAAFVLSMSVPTILASENWDDHDRSGRTIARDVGWNYLNSMLPNSIILNYGDNDTFPIWFNQEVDGVRTDVRVMNTSYLGGEWYIDQMKSWANDAAPVPLSLPRSKYAYVNDLVPIDAKVSRSVNIKDVVDFIRNDDKRTQLELMDGTFTDYIPTKNIALPVNRENALASGIVKTEDADKMVDTIYFSLPGVTIDKSEMMILDMLANFDWKRPIYFTQVYILQNLGLLDYLQFDGFAYRLVPIPTPFNSAWEVGRVDPDYAGPLLLNTFRYGNLSDPSVYVDYTIQYNLNASKTREGFARVATAYLERGEREKAVELLDAALDRLPTSQLRFTPANTIPIIEGYYMAEEYQKGDLLLMEYAQCVVEYIEYYLTFDGYLADMTDLIIDEKLEDLEQIYYTAAHMKRVDAMDWLNDYYRSLGADESELLQYEDYLTEEEMSQILDSYKDESEQGE